MEKREAKMLATQEWPVDTQSLVGQSWGGDCPYGHSEMFLNMSDAFECPTCRIQIMIDGRANISRLRGMGKFKTKRSESSWLHPGRISAVDSLPDVGVFRIEEDARVRS
jgi:hypothetical protein